MRRILILAAVTALTVARPEVYKEQEDFKYSRSSSDEGSKSGYYGAQRGNMGGNYERAHNMDSLAQHQMGGLVNQVEGELGDGANTKTGSVYTAANSRGVYGSGHYDVSNLAGRNFQEGASYGDSQSRASSLQSSSGYNAAYANSRSQSHGGYQAAGQTGHSYQAADLQGLHHSQGATGAYDYRLQSSSGHQSQSGFNSHNAYGNSDANSHSGNSDGSEVRTRLISAVPVRIVVRPGTRVAIPIGAQTYDINQGSLVYDANHRSSAYDASQRASSYDANERSSSYGLSSANSEAEALSGINRNNANKPASDAKHYESSYSYRKEWERHNTIRPTLLIPTENPNSQNSELYVDSQGQNSRHQYAGLVSGSQQAHSSTGYNANVKSSSSQSGYRSDLNSQHQLSSGSNLNAYTQAGYNTGSNGDLNSQVESINSQKPKSYQSSYSYHKSWERQGDPYVIQPASSGYYDGQAPQRLSAGTKTAYGTNHQSQVDCDEICGHARVARSYDATQYQQELGQQSQDLEDFGQQSQNLEEFGQQSQKLEDFGQQSLNLENFSQQSQHTLGKLEDLGQQSQKWDKLEDLGQQSQNTWDKYEDLGQQAQNTWDQQNQNTLDRVKDLGQQTQHTPEQNAQDKWDKLETKPQKDDQQTYNKWDLINTNDKDQQITQHQHQDIENMHVPHHNEWNQQQPQYINTGSFSQSPQNENDDIHKHRVETIWDKLNKHTMQNGDYNAHTVHEQASTDHLQNNNEGQDIPFTYGHNWNVDTTRYTQNTSQERTTHNEAYSHNFQSHSQHNSALFNLWNKLDTIEKQLEASSNKSFHEKYNSTSEYTNSQNSYEASRHEQSYYEEGRLNTTSSYQHSFAPSINVYDENKNKTFNINDQSSEYDKVRPQDIGRGDIGPEDLSAQTDVDVTEKSPNHTDIDKNPLFPVANRDIDIKNQMKEKDSNDQQRSESYDRNSSLVSNLPASISSSQNTENNVSLKNNEQRLVVLRKDIETFEQHNMDSLGQKTEGSHNFGAHVINLKEQVLDNKDQQNNQQQHSQKNKKEQQQQPHIQNLEPQNENIEQQNTQDFGQQNENLEQHNTQEFGQQNENLEQHNVQDFGQQNENLDQQNLQDFSQLNENLEHQNVQGFGQKNGNDEQQNLQDFGQKNENLEQQNIQDFGQQNENLEQQNIQDFGQQNENLEQQNVQGFAQQNENLEQQNEQGLGQQNENLEQQNLQDFGQQNENLEQQNVQDFGQQNENLEQQNVQDFGQHNENLEQQNLQDFGQQNENLEQQNVQDFGQQNENLEEQNVQDFGQQNENLEHIQGLGQQNENLEQQNIQELGQKNENLEQQNLQDFGQQNENLEQQNLQSFDQQNENLEQQNVQDFGQLNDGLQQQNLEHKNQQNDKLQQSVGQGRENYNQQGFHKFEQRISGNFEQQHSNNHEPLDNRGQVEIVWRPRPEKMEVIPVETPHNFELQSTPPKDSVIEPVTEKPGFWKSVGNKIVNAKDKVYSWFGS